MKPSDARVTVYTVAQRAGVSISTVSLAINHPHRVSDETRRRVLKVAAEAGYRTGSSPAASARLRIAIAAPFSSYPSYSRRLVGMLDGARRAAVELTVHDLESAAAAESPLLEALPARGGVDGIVVMGVPLRRQLAARHRDDPTPIVLVDAPDAAERRIDLPFVNIDDEAGGVALAEHLAERGHERAIFLHEPQRSWRWVSAGLLRIRGLETRLALADGEADRGTDLSALLRRMLSGPGAPTAVVANHDEFAGRAHRALVALGIRPGIDVALTGYDDGPLAEALDLTTVRQPFSESGRTALELLLARIAGTSTAVQQIVLRPELVVRSSSG